MEGHSCIRGSLRPPGSAPPFPRPPEEATLLIKPPCSLCYWDTPLRRPGLRLSLRWTPACLAQLLLQTLTSFSLTWQQKLVCSPKYLMMTRDQKNICSLTMSGHVGFESVRIYWSVDPFSKTSVLIFSVLGRLELENQHWLIHYLILILKTMNLHVFTHVLDLKLGHMNSKKVKFDWNWPLWVQWDLVTK